MKTVVPVVVFLMVALAQGAWGQGSRMYDTSYAGPMNVYGQPTFQPSGQPNNGPGGQLRTAPQQFPGLIPVAAKQASDMGSYLWSFLPAPLTGAQSPYAVPPNSGNVIVSFVPGSR